MRRILALVTLISVSLSPASSVATANAPTPVVPVIAVAASILSIASSVNSLFGGKKDKEEQEKFQQEVISRLAKIDEQLGTIQAKLDAINARFDELQVHIDKQFEHQRVVDVLAQLRTIDQHYPTWVATGYTPESFPTVPSPASVLNELRIKVAAVREYPSFANFSTVALGMAYEHLLLANVFKQSDDDQDAQRGFLQYAAFFKESASAAPDRSGTVGQSWVAADAEMRGVSATFAAIPKPLYCVGTQHLCVPSNPNDWNWYFNVVKITVYDGDPLTGFHPVPVSGSPEHDCVGLFVDGPGGNPEGVCKANPPIFPRQRFCTQLQVPQLANPQFQACPLEPLHQTALQRKQTLDELTAALKSLRGYYVQAARWGGTPEKKIIFLSPDMPPTPSKPAKPKAASSPKG